MRIVDAAQLAGEELAIPTSFVAVLTLCESSQVTGIGAIQARRLLPAIAPAQLALGNRTRSSAPAERPSSRHEHFNQAGSPGRRDPSATVETVPFLLGGSASPVGWVVSFIEAPAGAVLEDLVAWRESLGWQFTLSDPVSYPACLDLLDPLATPWTAELVVAHGKWSAYLDNDDGGDPTGAAPELARRLGVRCATAIHTPIYGPWHASTQLWLSGPAGNPPLMYFRTLAAHAEDGRWSWDESGKPLPFENTSRYKSRIIRRRFDRDLLITYLAALGISVDDAEQYGAGRCVRHIPARRTAQENRSDALQRLQPGERRM